MSRTENAPARHLVATLAGLGLGLVGIVAVGLVLREQAPGHLGDGFLFGGLVAVAAAAFAAWRAARRPHAASTFERAFTQAGDERDDLVLTRALAVVGAVALPAAGVAAIAISLDASPSMAMALLVIGQLVVAGVAFVVLSRRL